MKSKFDEGYEMGFKSGFNTRKDSEPAKDALKRLHYLEHGGEWHRETTGDLYVQGFKDALKTLGVIK